MAGERKIPELYPTSKRFARCMRLMLEGKGRARKGGVFRTISGLEKPVTK